MSAADFEELVDRAFDLVPPELLELVDNCVVRVEESAPEDDPDLLGLYDGIPLVDRGADYTMVLPDRITLFRANLLDYCTDEQDLAEQIAITVIHEIAHHFGIDDDRLTQLGWD